VENTVDSSISKEYQKALLTTEQVNNTIEVNAASAYLLSLRSNLSRKKMGYFLNNVARMTGN